MHRLARYGDAEGAWTGSTSAQNGSRWCSAQTALSRSRGTSANQPQRGQAIMAPTFYRLAAGNDLRRRTGIGLAGRVGSAADEVPGLDLAFALDRNRPPRLAVE